MPFGFICGFPTRGGDLYGGNLYGRSAAAPGPQAVAQAAAAQHWGEGSPGREQIAHPVCKGKYQPWRDGERQFGCFRHHTTRKARIAKAGLRVGWVSFEQWPQPDIVTEIDTGGEPDKSSSCPTCCTG